ncbi:MAG: SpoIID/LytB domain-containing protein [Candidatus Marinimicrobia bacterium]|nr:SpoIID/LytB domain-containing protein [Candidatus Neomarinimicrobiota bacterium]
MGRLSSMISSLLFASQVFAGTYFDSEPIVRVRIINTLDTLRLTLNDDWYLIGDDLDSILKGEDFSFQILVNDSNLKILDSTSLEICTTPSLRLAPLRDKATLGIASVPYGIGWWWGGVEDRVYEGELHVYLDSGNKMNVTVHLPLESYLKGVVPYEIGPDSPAEALKAQAVAARSEAMIALNSKLYSGNNYDLTSDVECQVFSGNHRRSPASDQAVETTRGIIISENGQAINAYYASNCGGHAELIENVWPVRFKPESYTVAFPDKGTRKGPNLSRNWQAKRWIKSSPEVYCNPEYESSLPSWSQRNFRWSREFSTAEITDMITKDTELGNLKRIKVLKRGISGRIYRIRFIFENGSFEKQGELTIRQLFEPSLRSACFYIKKTRQGFTLFGAGWGHGVGMCQSGAIAQASRGISFDRILKHYYPKSSLLNIYGSKKIDP